MQTQVEYGEVGLIGLPVELIVSDLNQELVEVEAAKDLICILILVLEMNAQVGSKYFFASPVLFDSIRGNVQKKKSIFKDIIQIKVDHPPTYPIFDKLFFDKF